MAKKIIINEEDEMANSNGLIILFFIVVAIILGSLSFIAGIIYTSYLEGKNEEECEVVKPIEEIIDEKTIENYLVTDNKLVKELNSKVNNIEIEKEVLKEQYAYNYLEDEKNYYVLLAYGSYEINGDKKVVYTSIDKKDIYKEYNKNESIVIDENNYNEFSKYRITFIKDGNDIIFKGIERIE